MANMSKDEKLQTARALMLAYTQQDPEGLGINANVVKPLSPSGPSMKNLMGSLPLGEGRVSAGMHGNKAYSLGYSQPLEGGQFNANLNVPRNNPNAAQLNLQYNKRFADGGDVTARQDEPFFDAASRTFVDVLTGRRTPITEKDFTAKEQMAMMDAVKKSQARGGNGRVDYQDYPSGDQIGPGYVDIRNTLGGFQYKQNPDGSTSISDRYDFHGPRVAEYEKMGTGEKVVKSAANALTEFVKGGFSPRDLAGELGRAYIGSKGPDVNIRIPVNRADGSPEEGEVQFKENKNPSFNQRLAEAMARDEIGSEGYYLRDSSPTASKQLAQMLKISNTALPASSVTPNALPPRYISDNFNASGWTYGSGPLKGQTIIAGDIPITQDPKEVMDRVNTQAHEAFHQRAGQEGKTLINRKSYSDELARDRIAKIMQEFQTDSDVKKGSAPNSISTAYWGLKPNRSKEEQIANLAGYEGMHPKGTSFLDTEVGKRMLKDDPRLIDYYFTQSSVPYGGIWEGQVKEPGIIDNASRMLKKFLVQKGFNTVNRANGSPEEGEVAPTAEEIAAASTPAFIAQKSGIGRKEGNISKALKSGEGYVELAKGLTNVPQNLVGAPMDISNMIANVYGGGVEKPFMGSEYLKEKSRAAGLGFTPSTDPTLAGFYGAGDLASNFVNPAAVTRTGVKAAEKTGEAAKMLARDFQKYNQQLEVPGASYAMKPKGGHYYVWPESSAAPEKSQVDAYLQMIENRMDKPNAAVADWVKSKVGRYIRSDFATEQDQMVKAAEEGKKLHFTTPRAMEESAPIIDPSVTIMRKTEGFPSQGFAKTEQGKLVENIVDSSVWPATLENTPTDYIPSSIRKFKDTDPNMRVYEFPDAVFEDNLKITNLANQMDKMMTEKTIKLWGQEVPVPKEYQLDVDTLKGLTPAQASNRVAMKEEWLAKKEPEIAGQMLAKDRHLVSHEYNNGSKWISPDDLADNDSHRELVTSVGCRGGWCTDKESFAFDYGSGENRLHILLDKNAQPRAQLTMNSPQVRVRDFILANPDLPALEAMTLDRTLTKQRADEMIRAMPEYQDFVKQNQGIKHITEIKGQFNKEDLTDQAYLKEVQDFIKRQGPELQSVENLDGIGMTDISSHIYPNKSFKAIATPGKKGIKDVYDEAIRVNGNSPYIENDPDVIDSVIEKAVKNVFTPKLNEARTIQMNLFQPPTEKAHGGMIERQHSDNRRYL